mgnify:FL=1
MKYTYRSVGTCSTLITVELDDEGVVKSVEFKDGCRGNTSGISALVKGMKADDVIARCKGITCGTKPTSCPDQLAQALSQALRQMKKDNVL